MIEGCEEGKREGGLMEDMDTDTWRWRVGCWRTWSQMIEGWEEEGGRVAGGQGQIKGGWKVR